MITSTPVIVQGWSASSLRPILLSASVVEHFLLHSSWLPLLSLPFFRCVAFFLTLVTHFKMFLKLPSSLLLLSFTYIFNAQANEEILPDPIPNEESLPDPIHQKADKHENELFHFYTVCAG